MRKKITAFMLAFVLLFVPVEINAANIISDGISGLSLAADRYYNTNIKYADMIVTKVNDEKYSIYYYHESGKSLTAQLYLTEWGTWNLGDWTLNNRGVNKTVIGGGTDWEYVFRVTNPTSQNLEFTGGNHGSEVCNYLTMYDSITGEVFELSNGQSKYVNRLVIEESTTILQANISYLPYANVIRKYTFTGDTINLDCKIEFVKDIKMSCSYSAMASVSKDFGTNCTFSDGTEVITSQKGFCSGKYMGNTEALSCTLTGSDPSASVTVGIYNKKDMTDNFSNRDKTFIWDMTEDFNKVYFSRENITDLNVIRAGTVWDFGTYWKINLQ